MSKARFLPPLIVSERRGLRGLEVRQGIGARLDGEPAADDAGGPIVPDRFNPRRSAFPLPRTADCSGTYRSTQRKACKQLDPSPIRSRATRATHLSQKHSRGELGNTGNTSLRKAPSATLCDVAASQQGPWLVRRPLVDVVKGEQVQQALLHDLSTVHSWSGPEQMEWQAKASCRPDTWSDFDMLIHG